MTFYLDEVESALLVVVLLLFLFGILVYLINQKRPVYADDKADTPPLSNQMDTSFAHASAYCVQDNSNKAPASLPLLDVYDPEVKTFAQDVLQSRVCNSVLNKRGQRRGAYDRGNINVPSDSRCQCACPVRTQTSSTTKVEVPVRDVLSTRAAIREQAPHKTGWCGRNSGNGELVSGSMDGPFDPTKHCTNWWFGGECVSGPKCRALSAIPGDWVKQNGLYHVSKFKYRSKPWNQLTSVISMSDIPFRCKT